MKHQETLTEINAAETARRDRALAYEQLTNEKALLAKAVAGLNKKVAEVDPQVKAFEKLLKIVEESVPATGLMTPGRRGYPGGENVKDAMMLIVQRSLETLRALRDDLDKTMAQFEAKQLKNKKQFAAYGFEEAA